ncbi:MAG: hydantoinase/oxoprolinase family protein, partial [Chloroflexi bacterium]|nr:hydantoinase/oxoprolinase family protein [Chloroflexota bacterium]
MASRLGIDVGGTFTDLLLLNDTTGETRLLKIPTTPRDQSVGILTGVEKILRLAGVPSADIGALLHGTTVSTNVVLEEKGARVGLILTRNFEQVLHMARSQTPGPLAGWIIMIKPDPLADLELTRGISARTSARGEVQVPLDAEEVRAHIRELHQAGIEALTVTLINSYANPTHEFDVKRIAQEMYPDLPIPISTDILPEFPEYERTLTTVMNS